MEKPKPKKSLDVREFIEAPLLLHAIGYNHDKPASENPTPEQIQAGDVSREWMQWIESFLRSVPRFLSSYQATRNEASALLQMLETSGIEEVEKYVSENPPSARVIVCLVVLAQTEFIKEQARKNGTRGGVNRHAKMLALKEWTLARYREGSWPSANKAAYELMRDVINHGRTIGAPPLSAANAQRTIANWIRESLSSG